MKLIHIVSSVLALAVVSTVLLTNTGFADEKDKNKDLRPGVMASQQRFKRAAAVDMSTNPGIGMSGTEAEQQEVASANPVVGKIVRRKSGQCTAVLTNSSEESYSLTYYVISTNQSGAEVHRHFFSDTVAPKGVAERTVFCDRDENLSVVLKSGKQLRRASAKRVTQGGEAAAASETTAISNSRTRDLPALARGTPFTPP